jgi:hypothetical protein
MSAESIRSRRPISLAASNDAIMNIYGKETVKEATGKVWIGRSRGYGEAQVCSGSNRCLGARLAVSGLLRRADSLVNNTSGKIQTSSDASAGL